jgi:uncharacterized protein
MKPQKKASSSKPASSKTSSRSSSADKKASSSVQAGGAKTGKTEPADQPRKTARAETKTSGAEKRATRKGTSARSSAPEPAAPATKKAPAIPAILLEGDQPAAPAPSGPGQRYALGPTPPPVHFGGAGELPEAYGTERLLLVARDPRWLYAHWDLTREQLRKHNSLSKDGHMVLRIYKNAITGAPVTEIHVHPESRNWFVPVDQGGTKYVGQLGYYDQHGDWSLISTSAATLTPPDSLSEDLTVRFATIPSDVPFQQLVSLVKAAVRSNLPLVEVLQQLRASGFKDLPSTREVESATWTSEQERALAKVISMDAMRRVWMGSVEITELIRRQLEREISSAVAAQFGLPTSPGAAVASPFSPFGIEEARKQFWFNINAELIIYGATEPDATVTIGGRQIKLRPDGTFSFRFVLPDGKYHLPVQARSEDGTDTRSADLTFTRSTQFRGEVQAHPQDPALKPPRVANVA